MKYINCVPNFSSFHRIASTLCMHKKNTKNKSGHIDKSKINSTDLAIITKFARNRWREPVACFVRTCKKSKRIRIGLIKSPFSIEVCQALVYETIFAQLTASFIHSFVRSLIPFSQTLIQLTHCSLSYRHIIDFFSALFSSSKIFHFVFWLSASLSTDSDAFVYHIHIHVTIDTSVVFSWFTVWSAFC